MSTKQTIRLAVTVESHTDANVQAHHVAEHLSGFGYSSAGDVEELDDGDFVFDYWLPDVQAIDGDDQADPRLAAEYTDEHRLIRDEIRALSDDDLDKEIAFADGFAHAKDGSAERAWRLELHAERNGRQHVALLACASEILQNLDDADTAVESDLGQKGLAIVRLFRTQVLLGLF